MDKDQATVSSGRQVPALDMSLSPPQASVTLLVRGLQSKEKKSWKTKEDEVECWLYFLLIKIEEGPKGYRFGSA